MRRDDAAALMLASRRIFRFGGELPLPPRFAAIGRLPMPGFDFCQRAQRKHARRDEISRQRAYQQPR